VRSLHPVLMLFIAAVLGSLVSCNSQNALPSSSGSQTNAPATAAAYPPATHPAGFIYSHVHKTNYDQSQAGVFTLPDVFALPNGTEVTDAPTWLSQRRPEILRLFEEFEYGYSPPRPANMTFDVFDVDDHALDGTAIRKQIDVYFFGPNDPHKMTILIYLPPSAREHPVPLFLGLSFSGVQSVISDPGIRLNVVWNTKTKKSSLATDASRGKSKMFPVQKILSRGYGVAVIYYCDIEPDFLGGIKFGVRSHYLKPGQTDVGPDQWGAIGAWAWGLSRAMDYLQTDPNVDSRRVMLVGQSRLGKTVMWEGAFDTRFAMTFASCSGCGGAKLSRRDYGETVYDLNRNYPYQFCANFQKFGGDTAALPMDSHMLIALFAPRPLFLNTGSLDQWSDPHGEFLAAVAATPVYHLFGEAGIESDQFPPLDHPILNPLGFQCHTGKHDILPTDWDVFMDDADKYLKPNG
jgi:hypothetical protein